MFSYFTLELRDVQIIVYVTPGLTRGLPSIDLDGEIPAQGRNDDG